MTKLIGKKISLEKIKNEINLIYHSSYYELIKKYNSTFLGIFWVLLYPILFLMVYLFIYMVVFKVRFPGYSEFEYVLYVFTGLVPYIAFMEIINTGLHSLRQNISYIKNSIIPFEIVPSKIVALAMFNQIVGILVIVLMSIFSSSLSLNIIYLPLILFFQFLFFLGLVKIFSVINIYLNDIAYFMNLFIILLLFLSPIAFTLEMLPEDLKFVYYFNPITYMIEVIRDVLIFQKTILSFKFLIFSLLSLLSYFIGMIFFKKAKNYILENE